MTERTYPGSVPAPFRGTYVRAVPPGWGGAGTRRTVPGSPLTGPRAPWCPVNEGPAPWCQNGHATLTRPHRHLRRDRRTDVRSSDCRFVPDPCPNRAVFVRTFEVFVPRDSRTVPLRGIRTVSSTGTRPPRRDGAGRSRTLRRDAHAGPWWAPEGRSRAGRWTDAFDHGQPFAFTTAPMGDEAPFTVETVFTVLSNACT